MIWLDKVEKGLTILRSPEIETCGKKRPDGGGKDLEHD